MFIKKIKRRRHFLFSPGERIIIRSLKESDLSFYISWFLETQIDENDREIISPDEVREMIIKQSRKFYIFIIEQENLPVGEISIFKDTIIQFTGKKAPFVAMDLILHRETALAKEIIELGIKLIREQIFRKELIYTSLSKRKIMLIEAFARAGFKPVKKGDFFISKEWELRYEDMEIENPYAREENLFLLFPEN